MRYETGDVRSGKPDMEDKTWESIIILAASFQK